ncbi:MAG: MipA/OmpV family protein, partial [Pseudomonadota bacterium]
RNAYFYSVLPQYAQPNRGAYDARGGYSGMQYLASLSRRYGSAWIGAYVRRDDLRGAVFERSPLVKSSSYVSAGFAVTWTIGQSSEMIDIEEN